MNVKVKVIIVERIIECIQFTDDKLFLVESETKLIEMHIKFV